MGKRKSSKKAPTKKKQEKLATEFTCLFCQHEKCIYVTMHPDAKVGNLKCKVCGQAFQAKITAISHPADVYYDWLDACDQVNSPENKAKVRGPGKAFTLKKTTDGSADEEDLCIGVSTCVCDKCSGYGPSKDGGYRRTYRTYRYRPY